MTDYTHLNLEQVENMAPRFGMPPELDARFARRALGCEQLGVSIERLAPSFRMPFGHTHGGQEEVYVVVEGSGRMKIGDEIVELRQWDAVRVGPGTIRNVEAGADGLALLIAGAPPTPPEDAEMFPGWWTD